MKICSLCGRGQLVEKVHPIEVIKNEKDEVLVAQDYRTLRCSVCKEEFMVEKPVSWMKYIPPNEMPSQFLEKARKWFDFKDSDIPYFYINVKCSPSNKEEAWEKTFCKWGLLASGYVLSSIGKYPRSMEAFYSCGLCNVFRCTFVREQNCPVWKAGFKQCSNMEYRWFEGNPSSYKAIMDEMMFLYEIYEKEGR